MEVLKILKLQHFRDQKPGQNKFEDEKRSGAEVHRCSTAGTESPLLPFSQQRHAKTTFFRPPFPSSSPYTPLPVVHARNNNWERIVSPARPREASTWKKRDEAFHLSYLPLPPFFISYYSLNPLVVHSSHALLSFLLLLPPSPLSIASLSLSLSSFQPTYEDRGMIVQRGEQVEETGKRQVAADIFTMSATMLKTNGGQWPRSLVARGSAFLSCRIFMGKDR